MESSFPPIVETLAALQREYETRFPEASARLPTALSHSEMRALESQLHPYRLPEEARALYSWHDGADFYVSPVPPNVLLPLASAIETRSFMMEVLAPFGGWNPLWLPIVDCWDGNYFFIVLAEEYQERAPLFEFSKGETYVQMIAPCLSAFLQASADCMRNGDFHFENDQLSSSVDFLHEKVQQLAFNGNFSPIDGETFFSARESENWPSTWRRAMGIEEDSFIPQGATCQIADYLARPEPTVIHGQIIGLMGSMDGRLMEVSDGSHSLTIFCTSSCVGVSRVRMGAKMELVVEPCRELLPMPFETADAVAIKIVPLS